MASENPFNLRTWDSGLVGQELAKLNILPRALSDKEIDAAQGRIVPATAPKAKIAVGTFSGTSKALTEVYHRIEMRFQSYFDVLGISPSLPLTKDLADKRKLYEWSPRSGPDADRFPPHLNLIPEGPDNLQPIQIFDAMRLLDTGFVLASIVPEQFKDFVMSDPNSGSTMLALDQQNQKLRKAKKNIMSEPNIGDCKDVPWYSDESFGQQQFTGANPTTIEIASYDWVKRFVIEADRQGQKDVSGLIAQAGQAKSLYVQDCSYFRRVTATADTDDLRAWDAPKDRPRFACASVALFQLTAAGKLHPLAIVLDYRGGLDKSVTIFNKRVSPTDIKVNQATDWAWRYAKTCASSADWIRHEVKAHLGDCHFVEEATIVAAHRAFNPDHLVYRCLEPHWLKTLPLNAAARATLVPHVVLPLIGLTEDATYKFINAAYNEFDWQGSYVPNDLKRRGFPIDQINSARYHNYAYGREILLMWNIIRKFVKAFVANGGKGFTTDAAVKADDQIKAWCTEMRAADGGRMSTFPQIQTVDQLVDAITMCIHIASPQHTAVNYAQEYYNSYVVNKPPSICAPLPKTLAELNKMDEVNLMRGLPTTRPSEWLLASHLVHLLSYKVAEDQNLVNYGVSLVNLYGEQEPAHVAGKALVNDLLDFSKVCDRINGELDCKEMPYNVLQPHLNAVSILI